MTIVVWKEKLQSLKFNLGKQYIKLCKCDILFKNDCLKYPKCNGQTFNKNFKIIGLATNVYFGVKIHFN